MVPSSICGRKPSCWALLNRWISSTNSSVPCPFWRRILAASNTLRSSGTPVKIAEICTKCRSVSLASSRAMVVLPTPGGPQKISDDKEPEASITPRGASGPSTWAWPITSPSDCGRSRSASGRFGAGCCGSLFADAGLPNRSAIRAGTSAPYGGRAGSDPAGSSGRCPQGLHKRRRCWPPAGHSRRAAGPPSAPRRARHRGRDR